MGGLITLLKRSASSFSSDKCSTLAAAIAYQTIFAIFPIALFGVAVLGFFMGDGSARQQVIDDITRVIPLGDAGSQALSKALAGTNSAKGWLSIIAIVTSAWSASGLFGTIRGALDSVWDVDRSLPLLRAKLRDLLLFLGFGGLLGAAVVSVGFLQGARSAGGSVLGPLLHLATPLFVVLTLLVPLCFMFLAFLYLYRLAPHARLHVGDVWPAAVIAALFFQFGTSLLSFYIVHLGNFNALAGSLGAAILLLVFVYYAAQVVLLAAELAKHRMLVRSGALAATDPKVETPSVPLTAKLKGMLVRLWKVEEPHHEEDLPYKPARMDPVTNAPTNTKEEVLINQQQSREQAEQEAQAREQAAPETGRAQEPQEPARPDGVHARNGGSRLAETPLMIYRPAKADTKAGKNGANDSVTAGDLFPPAEQEQEITPRR